MAVYVPDNNTYGLTDIYAAVNDHASPSGTLQSCFDNAEPSYFDADYDSDSYAPENSQKRFRNYGPIKATEGTYSISNPFGSTRFVGVFHYMSKTGKNYYVFGYLPGYDWRLVHFHLSDRFDLDSASYVTNIAFDSADDYHTGYSWFDMKFSLDGTRLMLGMTNSTIGSVNPYILTIVLSTAWDITSEDSNYETQLYGTTTNQRLALSFCFNEDGTKMFLLMKFSTSHSMYVFKLSTGFTLPSTSDIKDYSNTFGDINFGNKVCGTDFSTEEGQTYIALYGASYNHNVRAVETVLTESSIICNNSLELFCADTSLEDLAHFVFSNNFNFIYLLEDNNGVLDALFPVIKLRISPFII